MAEKILNTRIQLKYDSLANWNASTFNLKKGELAIVEVPTVEGSTLQPVMFKVGTGDKKFSELDWASAKAADVYAWAKKSGIDVNDTETGKFVTDFEWVNNELVIHRADVDWADVKNKVNASSTVDGLMSKEDKAKLDGIDFSTGDGIKAEVASSLDEAGIAQVKGIKVDNATNADTASALDATGEAQVKGIKVDNATNADVAAKVAHSLTIDSATFDGSADVNITDAVKSVAATEINRLIGAADDEGGETIQNIANLVDYVEKNGGQITQLVTDVSTANTNASNAVSTANTAAADAAQAKTDAAQAKADAATAVATANEAKESATNSANAALASENAAKTSETNAGNSATAAAGSADAAAKSAADAATAQGKAEEAQAAAKQAKEDANAILAEVNDAATGAQATADAANKTAGEAKTTAESAAADAAEAVSTANAAKSVADTAVQDVAAGEGLKATRENNTVTIGFDPDVVFVFDCGSATALID